MTEKQKQARRDLDGYFNDYQIIINELDKECKEKLLEIAVPKTEQDARHCAADKFAVTDGPVDKEFSEKKLLKYCGQYSD